jgi:Na+/melibiose symporter-like transporter
MRNVWHLIARNRNYRLLLGANLVSQGGDWILGIGMMYYVYVVTGSALASGAMLVVSMLPQLLLSSLAGVFVDRWDRRRTMIASNLLLAATCVPLFVVHDATLIWVVYLVVFVQGIFEQLFAPAEAAMVPNVVPADDLVAANALNGQNRQVARLAGAAVGGVLAAVGGIFLVALVDLVSYLVAAGLVAAMRVAPAVGPPVAPRTTRVRHEWVDGVRLCLADRELATLLTFRTLSGLGEGIIAALLAPFIISVLNATSTEYGAVISTQAIGGIAGGLAVVAIGKRGNPRTLLVYGAFFFGLVDLLMVIYPLAVPALWPIFGLIGLVGLPLAAMNAGYLTLQQVATPDRYRGRVFGALSTGWAAAMLLGIVLAGVLGDVVGIIAVISLQGVIHILAAPYVRLRLREPAAPLARPVPGVRVVEETAS